MTGTTTAFLFPGQGGQVPGMGTGLRERHPDLLNDLYAEADEIVRYPLTNICTDASRTVLRDMTVTQPAVFITSYAATVVARAHGLTPDVVAGHSLGEYAALTCAGVLDWRDALRLVHLRGQLMRHVHRRTDGKMAAIIGVELADVESLCAKVARELGRVVEIANENEPRQVVISGESDAVDVLLDRVGALGAERTLILRIGGPAHSSLMGEAGRVFASHIAATTFADPSVDVVSSARAALVQQGAELQSVMSRQLVQRVRWVATMSLLHDLGVSRTLELGVSKVLTAIVRRQYPAISTYRTDDASSLATAVKEWSDA